MVYKWIFFLIISLILSGCSTYNISEDKLQTQLRNAGIYADLLKTENGCYALDMSRNNVTNIDVLKGMPLSEINFYKTPISDISPLEDMPLKVLLLAHTKVKDIIALKNLPIERLDIDYTEIEDVFPLQGMKIKVIYFNPDKISKGINTLRNMKSIEKINTKEPSEFWEWYDKSKFGKSGQNVEN